MSASSSSGGFLPRAQDAPCPSRAPIAKARRDGSRENASSRGNLVMNLKSGEIVNVYLPGGQLLGALTAHRVGGTAYGRCIKLAFRFPRDVKILREATV